MVAAALTGWSFGYTRLKGSDLWWHLAAGRWMTDHRALPAGDPWSFTAAGSAWLNHEWLSDVVFDLWSRAFGQAALVCWKWAVLAATAVLLLSALRRLTGEWLGSYLALLLALVIAAPFLDLRPHLYTLLGLALLLWLAPLTTEGWQPLRNWRVALLPPLFLLWSNLHGGGALFGLAALAVLLGPGVLRGGAEGRRRGLLLWGACAFGTLLTPWGWRGLLYPMRYALRPANPLLGLSEWLPPFHEGALPAPAYPWGASLFLACAVALAAGRDARRHAAFLSGAPLGFLTLAMSLRSCRFIPLFALCQAPVTAFAISRCSLSSAFAPARRVLSLVLPLAAAGLAAWWLWAYPLGPRAFRYLTVEESFPAETCDFIEVNSLSGKVFNEYGWGGYLDLRTGGRLAVFIDGRADTVFDEQTVRRYLHVFEMQPGWQEAIERSDADFILWPTQAGLPMLQALVDSGRWRLLHQDFVSVLLERSDRPERKMRDPADSAWVRLAAAGERAGRGDYVSAEASFRAAVERDPDLLSAWLGLARALREQGKIEEARRALRDALGRFPAPEARAALAEMR